MVGPPTASNGNFTFNPGNSNAMTYSGVDLAAGSTDIIPPVGWRIRQTAQPIHARTRILSPFKTGLAKRSEIRLLGTRKMFREKYRLGLPAQRLSIPQ